MSHFFVDLKACKNPDCAWKGSCMLFKAASMQPDLNCALMSLCECGCQATRHYLPTTTTQPPDPAPLAQGTGNVSPNATPYGISSEGQHFVPGSLGAEFLRSMGEGRGSASAFLRTDNIRKKRQQQDGLADSLQFDPGSEIHKTAAENASTTRLPKNKRRRKAEDTSRPAAPITTAPAKAKEPLRVFKFVLIPETSLLDNFTRTEPTADEIRTSLYTAGLVVDVTIDATATHSEIKESVIAAFLAAPIRQEIPITLEDFSIVSASPQGKGQRRILKRILNSSEAVLSLESIKFHSITHRQGKKDMGKVVYVGLLRGKADIVISQENGDGGNEESASAEDSASVDEDAQSDVLMADETADNNKTYEDFLNHSPFEDTSADNFNSGNMNLEDLPVGEEYIGPAFAHPDGLVDYLRYDKHILPLHCLTRNISCELGQETWWPLQDSRCWTDLHQAAGAIQTKLEAVEKESTHRYLIKELYTALNRAQASFDFLFKLSNMRVIGIVSDDDKYYTASFRDTFRVGPHGVMPFISTLYRAHCHLNSLQVTSWIKNEVENCLRRIDAYAYCLLTLVNDFRELEDRVKWDVPGVCHLRRSTNTHPDLFPVSTISYLVLRVPLNHRLPESIIQDLHHDFGSATEHSKIDPTKLCYGELGIHGFLDLVADYLDACPSEATYYDEVKGIVSRFCMDLSYAIERHAIIDAQTKGKGRRKYETRSSTVKDRDSSPDIEELEPDEATRNVFEHKDKQRRSNANANSSNCRADPSSSTTNASTHFTNSSSSTGTSAGSNTSTGSSDGGSAGASTSSPTGASTGPGSAPSATSTPRVKVKNLSTCNTLDELAQRVVTYIKHPDPEKRLPSWNLMQGVTRELKWRKLFLVSFQSSTSLDLLSDDTSDISPDKNSIGLPNSDGSTPSVYTEAWLVTCVYVTGHLNRIRKSEV
ncbi:hypothetical protein D9756_006845 [Leucocoprinus leucothites]|uniref:Uncharacterized protein n=1 Tax=Leucocoprinus leucothites TaxID=201217 RepID=A0A8H5G2L7_9AGAR|nr:hypothetical protein D9756_006845 [Leucoagaricus leucothites]